MKRINIVTIKNFYTFTSKEWAHLEHNISTSLNEQDISNIQGINERLSLQEIYQIYLPIIRLFDFQKKNKPTHKTFIIGLCGSVSVGKTTIARLLQALLQQHLENSHIDIISTDNFIYPLETLIEKNLLSKKGFPESYNSDLMIDCITNISQTGSATCPIYSHIHYDILPDQFISIKQPNVLIVEGLNTLQSQNQQSLPSLKSFFDISIYIDAPETLIKDWYIERFLKFKKDIFPQKENYFHHYSKLSEKEAIDTASEIWDSINGFNLKQFIKPTKDEANIILQKGRDHFVEKILVDEQTQADIRRYMANNDPINL